MGTYPLKYCRQLISTICDSSFLASFLVLVIWSRFRDNFQKTFHSGCVHHVKIYLAVKHKFLSRQAPDSLNRMRWLLKIFCV